MTGPARRARLLAAAVACAGLVGCARGCTSPRPPIHVNPNMDWQPRYDPQEESAFFHDGSAMRLPVPGTVARGRLVADERVHSGREADGTFVAASPVAVDEALVARGAARFSIHCQPCHGKRGTGQGILAERGGVPVPSFHEQRIRDLADGEIFDVVTNGKGLMSGYRYPLSAEERWAVIAHVRGLQAAGRGAP